MSRPGARTGTVTDVAVVGSGPNGLAAAVTMARAGLSVEVYEAADTIGGGLRTTALFDSDVVHDLCSAVHPMAAASPFFRAFDLAARGAELLHAPISYAHPLDDGRAALAHRDLDETCAHLGSDGPAWRRLMAPLLEHSTGIAEFFLSDLRSPPRDLAAPLALAPRVLRHATRAGSRAFRGDEAAALLTGVAAHAVGPLPSVVSSAVALFLGHLAHGTGWPLVKGGSGALARAMEEDLVGHGGVVRAGQRIEDLRELDHARVVLADIAPRSFVALAGHLLPTRHTRALKAFRYGPGAAKVDFLCDGPVPWKNPDVGLAGTVHLGGPSRQTWRSESLVARGVFPDEPFVLVVDPAVTDPGREVRGRRPVWAYAHVPHGCDIDPEPVVRRRIEQYAPGFGDTVIAHRSVSAAALEEYNPNYVGGDIGAGALTLRQMFLRPGPSLTPYRTPLPGVYLCSASTPPGPSVHGMSGHLAALSALRHEFGVRTPPSLAPGA